MTRLLTEFGMGTSLRRQDYTQAARRALQDALWHNSINLAELYGQPKEAMQIAVEIGVQHHGLAARDRGHHEPHKCDDHQFNG